jgi:integrase
VLVRENGKPIKEFRAAWRKLTAAAGVPDLLVHGLRRSAAHALRAAGIPESLIMKTGGWLTEDVFRRYAIESGSDRRQVVDMMEAARERSGLFLVPDLKKADEKAG